MKKLTLLLFVLSLVSACNNKDTKTDQAPFLIDTIQGKSLLGTELISSQVDPIKDSVRISNYLLANKKYLSEPDNPDALIWKGRRMAYLGDYKTAIDIFTEGIKKFPYDARMYRHRGHRYISLRQFDLAIADLEKSAELIAGTEDTIEPDGIPNARGIPVSTTHRNIWYHLGLAYYLVDDMENALRGFNNCREISDNPDMFVASSHWVYMILRRMEQEEEAREILQPIDAGMDVFENMSYHNLLLFYKGDITEAQLIGGAGEMSTANNAVVYGLGNWYYYNGEVEKANAVFTSLVDKGIWAAFGTIAAEADLARME